MKKLLPIFIFSIFIINAKVQGQPTSDITPAPPMGWMSWNYFGDKINEKDLKEMADSMVSTGMAAAGYNYIFIDDGWQGGRDIYNQIIPDPKKFPSGMKALADYMHSKGLKLGIYSDAALLTCAGYTASLHFEEQDAKTFADWGIDYLKYDYCNAPPLTDSAVARYSRMSNALRNSGRKILLGVCEWGVRKPWLWAADAGGTVWRTTYDIRDKWQRRNEKEGGDGIMDIFDVNSALYPFAKPGHWNDPDMLIVGLYGKNGPSGDLGGTGCTDIEYQTQFSLWAMMNAPLYATNDVRKMNAATKNILLNSEIIAIDQDPLSKQAVPKTKDSVWNILVKPLANGDVAIAMLNRSAERKTIKLSFAELELNGKYMIRDLWQKKNLQNGRGWTGSVESHETKVFRLSKIK